MLRGLVVLILVAGTGACSTGTDPASNATRFDRPILGVPLSSLFYGAYVDEGEKDYSCGPKYYTAHQGTDILLRNFRTQDSGVTVIAAAAGTVEAIHDGEPDRNTVRDVSRPWNFVSVHHPDGLSSYYGHLRAGSVKVTVGQKVVSGTPLGLVGSSGNSNWPHLHFEVRLGTEVHDPWRGSCQPAPSLWRSQLAYQDEFRVLDSGILDRPAGDLDDLLERPPDAQPVTGRTGLVTFWAELYNIRAVPLRVEFYGPDGALVDAVEYASFATYSATYAAVSLPLGPSDPPGSYLVLLLARPAAGGALAEIARKTFTFAPQAAGAAVRADGPRRASIRLLSPGGDGPSRP